eukprot:Rmarinus@m.26279
MGLLKKALSHLSASTTAAKPKLDAEKPASSGSRRLRVGFHESVLSNTDVCADFIVSVIDSLTNFEYPELTSAQLARYGMSGDPWRVPLRDYILYLLSFLTEREMMLGVIEMMRVLNVSSFLDSKPVSDLTKYNRHRVFFVAVMLAHKFFVDEAYNNVAWTKIGQFWTMHQVSSFERRFLFRMDWRLNVSPEEFAEVVHDADFYVRTRLSPGTSKPSGIEKSSPPGRWFWKSRGNAEDVKVLPPSEGSNYQEAVKSTYALADIPKQYLPKNKPLRHAVSEMQGGSFFQV